LLFIDILEAKDNRDYVANPGEKGVCYVWWWQANLLLEMVLNIFHEFTMLGVFFYC
jgi:hypothetical protein